MMIYSLQGVTILLSIRRTGYEVGVINISVSMPFTRQNNPIYQETGSNFFQGLFYIYRQDSTLLNFAYLVNSVRSYFGKTKDCFVLKAF